MTGKMRQHGRPEPTGSKGLRQKPHVRFLEGFPVQAVGRCRAEASRRRKEDRLAEWLRRALPDDPARAE